VYVTDDEDEDEFLDEILFRIDVSSGNRTIVSDNSIGAEPRFDKLGIGIDVNAFGRVLVSAQTRVLSVDPSSGIRTLVSGEAMGSGPNFNSAVGLAYDPFSQSVLLSDFGAQALFRVHPVTGDRTILSDNLHGLGPSFVGPRGIAVVPLLISEPSSQAIAVCGICSIAFLYALQRKLLMSN
jgi:hypothetical protein